MLVSPGTWKCLLPRSSTMCKYFNEDICFISFFSDSQFCNNCCKNVVFFYTGKKTTTNADRPDILQRCSSLKMRHAYLHGAASYVTRDTSVLSVNRARVARVW